jgi:DNA-binding transcriptional LysR family regulator
VELRHLRYFVAVAEELSFRRAADRLHLSQPALGRQVRDLEDEIGAPLFDRNAKGVALTDAGGVFLESARRLLRDADDAIQAVAEAVRGERGRLGLGNIAALTASFLPRLLTAFHHEAPRGDLDVVELGPDEQIAGLLDDSIQIGFQTTARARPLDVRFESKTIMRPTFLVAMPMGHRFARQRCVGVADLATETLLNLRSREGAGYERWLRALCEEEGGFSPRLRRPPLMNTSGLFAMVAGGQGIAVVADVLLLLHDGRGLWTTRPLRAAGGTFEINAVWRRDDPSLVLKKFLALLEKQAPYASRARRGR